MKLIFLGTSSAFDPDLHNYHSNMLIKGDRNTLLIDCGTDIPYSLHNLKMNPEEINHIYVSHLHSDHVGGLEWLIKTVRERDPTYRPKLSINVQLVEDLWSRVLCSVLEGHIEDYFEVETLENNQSFSFESIDLNLVQTVHATHGFCLQPCFGLFFTVKENNYLITSDAQFTEDQMHPFYKRADLIFQDCETKENPSGLHARFEDLKTLPKEIKEKMWLYHYETARVPNLDDSGFLGFVKPGQVLNLS